MATTIITTTDGDTMTVDSWPTGVPGLSVVPFYWLGGDVEPGWYRLSHDGSGMAVGPYAYKSRAAATRAAQGVADILDWTEPFDDLREHPRLDEIREACRSEGVHEADLAFRGFN